MVVPEWLQIELSGICSLNCDLCAYSKRKKEHKILMDRDLVIKTLDDIISLNRNPRIELAHFGESTLNPDFRYIISELESRNFTRGCVITNSSNLNKEESLKIIRSNSIEEIVFSIYGSEIRQFEKFTNASGLFNKIEGNIFRFLMLCLAEEYHRKNPLKVTFSIIPHGIKEDYERTFNFWADIYEEFNNIRRLSWKNKIEDRFWYCQVDSRAGTVDYPEKLSFNWCEHHRELIVFANGDVSFCCMNSLHESILGNIKDDTLYNIWNSEKSERIRRDYANNRQYNIELCNHCPVRVPTDVKKPDWLLDYKE